MDRNISQMEESYARLDAALGSPGLGIMRTPKGSRKSLTQKALRGEIDISAMLDGTLNTSAIPNTSLGMSMLEEVTAPVFPGMLPDSTMDITSAALLSEDDPGVRATQVLFSEFVKIMVDHPSKVQIWEELEAYQQICSQQVAALDKLLRKVPRHHTNFTNTQQIYSQLLSERNTWRLLGSMYNERLTEKNNEDSPMPESEHISDFTIINQLYDGTSIVREAQIVIDWLEKNSADDFFSNFFDRMEYFTDTHIAWENTMKTIKQNGNTGMSVPLRGCRPLVTSLDPDASLRQGKNLHDLDKEDEIRLLRLVFAHIRSGQIDAAQDLCIRTGHHWRAATLEGWKLHHDPNHSDASQRNPIMGNPRRDVWKAVAWQMSSDERLPSYERAVYGTLCGNLQAILGVCHEWHDVLWAYARTMIDQWAEEQLRSRSSHLRALHPLPKDYPEEKFTLKAVFESVERRCEAQKQRSKSPYHIIQKFIILDDIQGLLQEAHTWLSDGISPHLLRCITHVLLFLRRIGRIPMPLENLCSDILVACVKEAIERGDVEQVARYTSVLPVWLQVEWYGRFLHNITDDHHRRHALKLAADVGLDTSAITTAVVTNIRLASSSRDPEGEVLAEMTAEDRVKVNAIDWLLYDEMQRIEALRQANAMMRSFLVSRKIGTTRALLNKVPSDTIGIITREYEVENGSTDLSGLTANVVREYFSFRTFVEGQEAFTEWFDHFHQKRPQPPKKPPVDASFPEKVAHEQTTKRYEGDLERWQQTLNLLTKSACEKLYNVLLFPGGGWLVDSGLEENEQDMTDADGNAQDDDGEIRPESPEPDRKNQLTVLRSVYIPQVTSLLQNILHSSEKYKESLQLADIIASEQYQLYKAFGACELQRFLVKLQETSRELLDRNCDALGYPQ